MSPSVSARTREVGADADDDVCVRACSGARMHDDDDQDATTTKATAHSGH